MHTFQPEAVTLYAFSELSEEAQARAIDTASQDPYRGSDWDNEWRDSLTEACKVLPMRVDRWEVNYCGSYACAEFTEEYGYYQDAESLSGVRAWKWLHNNGIAEAIGEPGSCPFTGYTGDESLLDPLRSFLRAPDACTLGELMLQCADSWAQGWQTDIEWQFSEECLREELESDDEEVYLADGSRS